MNEQLHISRFRQVRAGMHGDPHSMLSERGKILWTLAAASSDDELHYLTSTQISEILRECEGIDISRQKVSAVLKNERGTVACRKIKKQKHFKIMKLGEDEVGRSSLCANFVDPERALSEIRRIEEILAELQGHLLVCDPYVDNKTLDYIAECTSAKGIAILTYNIYGQGKFRRDLSAFRKEHPVDLHVRTAATPDLHDRYIIHDSGLLLLGTSLNGFAKKQSFVVALGMDLLAAAKAAFDKHWAAGKAF